MAASIAFQQARTQGGGGSSFTLTFTAASAAGQERLVALGGIVSDWDDTVIGSVTIDGQAATQVGPYVRNADADTGSITTSSGGAFVSFWRAAGTSATSVAVSFNVTAGGMYDARGALWSLNDAGTLLDTGTASSHRPVTGDLSLDLDVAAGGVAAGIYCGQSSTTHALTWVGLTERYDGTADNLYGGDWFSVADLTTGSASALTATVDLPNDFGGSFQVAVGLAVSFNPAGGAAGPIVHYPFDDTTTTDASGNGNTGTLAGSGTTLVTGKIGSGALSFNGSGYVTFTSVADLGLGSATTEISCATWIKTSSTDGVIVALRNSGNGNTIFDFVVGYNGVDNAFTGKLSCIIRDSAGAGLQTINAPSALNDNAWHHVAITRTSGKLLTLYVDGSSVATATDTITSGLTPDVAGSAIAYERFNAALLLTGSLDDFRIYKRALSSTEVAALYAAGASTPVVLTAAAGSYTITGTAAPLLRKQVAAAGAYALTGTAAVLVRKQTAAAGSYAITGTAAALALRQTAAAGAYTLTGTAATFVTPFVLPAAAGTYTITGTVATLAYTDNVTFAAAAGAYAYTGTAAAFQVGGNVVIATDPGAYALTGSAVTFVAPVTLPAAAGSYALTGSAATFATTSNVTFFCGSGAYTLTGSAVAFLGAELPPEPTPPPGAGGYAGALYRPYRFGKKRKRDDEEPPEPVYPPDLPPPPLSPSPPNLPAPPLHALIDLMPPPRAPSPRPTQGAKPAVADDDDDEAVELILKLLS